MNPVIKICGMRESANIQEAAELKPDILGFIFYPESPRFAGEKLDPRILASLPRSVRKAGVFVNSDFNEIQNLIEMYSLDIVQLHGEESPELCRRIKNTGIQVIKSFNIQEKIDFKICTEFIGNTDYFLFDTKTIKFGGSGQKFNWKLLENYEHAHPFFLSGGISSLDTDKLAGITNPSFHGIDLNSRFEIQPGIKDIEKLKIFINGLRHKQN
jgi:phosphoribosylanthranilate isomerase